MYTSGYLPNDAASALATSQIWPYVILAYTRRTLVLSSNEALRDKVKLEISFLIEIIFIGGMTDRISLVWISFVNFIDVVET